jgi:hypothetical protein
MRTTTGKREKNENEKSNREKKKMQIKRRRQTEGRKGKREKCTFCHSNFIFSLFQILLTKLGDQPRRARTEGKEGIRISRPKIRLIKENRNKQKKIDKNEGRYE